MSKLAEKLQRVCRYAIKRMRRGGKQSVGRRGEIVLIDESKCGLKGKVFILFKRLTIVTLVFCT